MSPLEAALGVAPGRTQLDGPKAAVKLGTDGPSAEAPMLFGALTGGGVGSERRPTVPNPSAEGRTVVDGIPPRHEIAPRRRRGRTLPAPRVGTGAGWRLWADTACQGPEARGRAQAQARQARAVAGAGA